jgi:hypothetical protein
MGDVYNFPAFTTMSIMQAMVALPMPAPGQKLCENSYIEKM